ncbi:MAG: tripartite tricarboxylate transporter substrate binding protein [Gammaproteobacteria bacterium]|nr:tripartite tricarboxylate transporter substrate binding protein [Gammaproteobacteria bacterium]
MKRRGLLRWTLAVLAVTGALLPAGCAREGGSGEYPSKPVTIVVPYAPGGGGDTFTRAVAAQAADILGVKVFVENRTGGGGTIGVGSVARAAADGYTLAFVSTSPVVMAPNFLDVPYDPLEDFTYLARFVVSVHPVLVGGESPFDSFPAVLEFARANPGRLRWSTAGINGAPHVATLAAFRQEGVEATFVPMQGSSEVLAGLLGGTIDLGVISDYSGALAAGDVRVLAEIGPEPIPGLPAVPTYEQLGYPLAPAIFFGLAGPAELPRDVVARWDDAIRTITASAAFSDIAERLNGNVAYLGHEEFERHVRADIAAARRTLRTLGSGD